MTRRETIGPVVFAAVALALGAAAATAQELSPLERAKAAYDARADEAQAKAAVELFAEAAAADPASYEARWRGAAAAYFYGTYPREEAPDKEKMAIFQGGITLAQEAVELQPRGVEGHFWLGVLFGVYGEAKGIMKSLALVDDIEREMKTCLELDQAFEGWGADRVLGRMLFKLPFFKGGDKKKSIEHLERSLAGRARASAALSIPDQLRSAYGPAAARLGAAVVLLMAIPAAYVLMLGQLLEIYVGFALPLAVVLGTAFTAAYVVAGGFRAVVRTNAVQFALMFAAFLIVLPAALARVGGPGALWAALPASCRAWDGGAGAQYVIVWYFIALQTLVEPTFYQRCYAARSPAVARRGILVSVGFWVLFDFLTTFSGLAARVLIPDLADPAMSYPELGRLVLPRLANALFAVGLFATVMSTAHSYLFLGAATLGHDVVPELAKRVDERRWTMVGLGAVGAAAVAIALSLRSVIGIWHDVGSVVTASLLLPLALSHFPARWRYTPAGAVAAMAGAAAVSVLWLVVQRLGGRYPLGVEPIFPALVVAALAWVLPRLPLRRGGGWPRPARRGSPGLDAEATRREPGRSPASWRASPTTLATVVATVMATSAAAAGLTVSGRVTTPGGAPVQGVAIEVVSGGGAPPVTTATDANGTYTAEFAVGWLTLDVRPPLGARLGRRFFNLKYRHTSFTFDVVVYPGFLVSGTVQHTDGNPRDAWMELAPNSYSLLLNGEAAESLPVLSTAARFETVVRAGSYYLRHLTGYQSNFPVHQVDLSTRDVTDLVIRFKDVPDPPYPAEPPVAERITIGPPDGEGIALVTGAPGASLPNAWVLVVNQRSAHQARVVAGPDGSFAARVFAPPGSPVFIRHGYPDWRWDKVDLGALWSLTAFPGTTLIVPPAASRDPGAVPFADLGTFDLDLDPNGYRLSRVGTTWAVEGVQEPAAGGDGAPEGVSRTWTTGETVRLRGTLTLTGPALGPEVDPAGVGASAWIGLLAQHDAAGRPLPWRNYFMSSFLTPTGFPVQLRMPPLAETGASVTVSGFVRSGQHALAGSFEGELTIPPDLPSGIYRPALHWSFGGFPLWQGNGTVAAAISVTPPNDNFWPPRRAVLAPLRVAGKQGAPAPPRLVWHVLLNSPSLGTRGTGAAEDVGTYALASQIVTQGAPYVAPRFDAATGAPIRYRLEPYLPMLSWGDRKVPLPPDIPLRLPGGRLEVTVTAPSGRRQVLGEAPFLQPLCQSPTTRGGQDPNAGGEQMQDVYSLTTLDDRFSYAFEEWGRHVIELRGEVEDVWGTRYAGGGTYEIWAARPLHLDPGVVPGTPLAAGQAFNPTVRLAPPVPATIELTVTHYPQSDPGRRQRQEVTGQASAFGTFSWGGAPIRFDEPGEYRVDLKASYTSPAGVVSYGAATWGGVVMTPPAQARLRAHGRRGLDFYYHLAPQWVVAGRDFPVQGTYHVFNPYHKGDVIWSNYEALLLTSSVQDPGGTIEPVMRDRLDRTWWLLRGLQVFGFLDERLDGGEIPLFTSARSGRSPLLFPEEIDQIGYSYCSSQRPGVRVREAVAPDTAGGYWRLDETFDGQDGVGILGDLPNDFKLEYVGAVFRDLENGRAEYLGHGAGWVHLPFEGGNAMRVMPPFAGPGNGGWTTEGGPLLTLRGREIHMFIHPTGTAPGAVLAVGDTFHFAGHLMPTLPGKVEVEVTSPTGQSRSIGGTANEVGYFYDPAGDLRVDEAGVWRVRVHVRYEGACSGGQVIPPYPSGGVLGSDDGEFVFYVLPRAIQDLDVSTPAPGMLSFPPERGIQPITIGGRLPPRLSDATLDYTVTMPGFILAHGRTAVSGGTWAVTYDPVTLSRDFPNLDLAAADATVPGLADLVFVSLFLEGTANGSRSCHANAVTLHGNQVFVGDIARGRGERPLRRRITGR